MEYIDKAKQPEGCLFCRVLAAPPSQDLDNLVVWRPEGGVVMLNRFPYNSGHLMVAPAVHRGDLADLLPDQMAHLSHALQVTLRVVRGELEPEGFNVGANIGRVAGAGIPDHVHLHVVPRWNGDTNFMPVLGETKVINEHLTRTAEKLSAAFAAGLDLDGGGVTEEIHT
jgi:ATP adenylyltransferase